jgi:hypothetical protein
MRWRTWLSALVVTQAACAKRSESAPTESAPTASTSAQAGEPTASAAPRTPEAPLPLGAQVVPSIGQCLSRCLSTSGPVPDAGGVCSDRCLDECQRHCQAKVEPGHVDARSRCRQDCEAQLTHERP